jgi:putative nucleotidyltransferase with HDIG domain
VRHRIRQFRDAGKRPSEADFELAHEHLGATLFELFRGQHPRDIVHSAGAARWLLERGHTNPDLIAAALLHDVGKGHQRRMDRVAYVLASYVRVTKFVGSAESRFALRSAVFRSDSHGERGAEMLGRAGAHEAVVTLTRLHHMPQRADPVLALLQQADAAN